MNIPERLKVEAGRYGNSVMISEIMKEVSGDGYELVCILPNRQGIIVIDADGNKQILLRGGQTMKVATPPAEHITVPIREFKRRGKSHEVE